MSTRKTKNHREHDHDYITGAFKKIIDESGTVPTFMQFLVLENELETELANDAYGSEDQGNFQDMEDFGDEDFGGEDEFEDVELDLDTDERFLSLPRPERVRLKKLSREITGYELEDELEQAYTQSVEGKPYFTTDDAGDDIAPPPEFDEPVRRRKPGASHAYKIRRLGELQ